MADGQTAELGLEENLYWNGGSPVDAPKQDKRSVVADPLFVDPKNGDYRLNPSSPVKRTGFTRFDTTGAGRLSKKAPAASTTPWPAAFPAEK